MFDVMSLTTPCGIIPGSRRCIDSKRRYLLTALDKYFKKAVIQTGIPFHIAPTRPYKGSVHLIKNAGDKGARGSKPLPAPKKME
jgi:hypothetical protein